MKKIFKIDENTGILIKKAARLFEQVANQNLNQLGVTYSQTIFLVRLLEKDGQSQIDLAKSAGLKQPTVVRILDRMERDGLIKRSRNQLDKRVFNFFLTEKGIKVCHKLEAEADAMHEVATVNVKETDIAKLNKYLFLIIENLESFLKAKN